jgi:hypothetical protein
VPVYNYIWWPLDITDWMRRFKSRAANSMLVMVWPPEFFRSRTLSYNLSAISFSSTIRMFLQDFFYVASITSENIGILERCPKLVGP